LKIERAVKKLPAWKVAEFIDRLEDRRVKKQDETTKDGAKATAGFNVGLPGLGGISASVAGMNLLTASRFFKERFTKKGREARIERQLTEQSLRPRPAQDAKGRCASFFFGIPFVNHRTS